MSQSWSPSAAKWGKGSLFFKYRADKTTRCYNRALFLREKIGGTGRERNGLLLRPPHSSKFLPEWAGEGGFLQKALSDMVVSSTQYVGSIVFLSGFPLGGISG